MKKAFTMIELIFVIIIIGILAAVIMPRSSSNKLYEAATQVVSHIRYTQHLAIVDDKFKPSDATWYKKRWQIRFKEDLVYSGGYIPNGTFENQWAYTIYNDISEDGNPNTSEMAKNPMNSGKYLSGGYNNTLHLNDDNSTKEMRLGTAYGIDNITFSSSCSLGGSKRIAFDYMGRPLRGASDNYTSAYPASDKLITSTCIIKLFDNDENVSIAIEPETGYAHIL